MTLEERKAVSDKDLITILENQLERASDYSTTALQENRRQSWNYYFNRPRADDIVGRSRVQDTSIADAIESLMAVIMPSYSGDHIISFEPEGPDDEDQSEAESLAVNNMFVEGNMGFTQLTYAIKSALMQRNGIIKVWVEDRQEVSTVRPQDVSPEGLAAAVAALESEGDAEVVDESVRVTRTVQRLMVKAIEPAYMYLDPNAQDQDLQNVDFIAERWIPTRSELVEMGIDKTKIDDLPTLDDETVSTTGTGSNGDILAKYIDGVADQKGYEPWATQRVECHWIHARIDRDGDGIAELKRFLMSNRMILIEEAADFVPYSSGTPWVVPFRWSGLSVFDKLKQTVDAKTHVIRQFLDNLNISNNTRTWGVEGMVNIQDALNSRPGGHVRVKDPNAFGEIPHQDISMPSLTAMEWFDKVRAEQVGASLDLQQADDQLVKAGVTAQSVDRQISNREQIAAMANRTLAETLVRGTFLNIHRALRHDWSGPIMFKKSGVWQETFPGEWQSRTRLNVVVGMSPGERGRASSALMQVIQMQLNLIQSGQANILTDYNRFHRALIDWSKVMEIPAGDAYFMDPDSPESQQGQQASAQASQQQAQMMQALQEAMQQLEQFKAQDDSRKWQEELKHKYYDTNMDAEVEEAKIVNTQITSRETARANGEAGSSGQSES